MARQVFEEIIIEDGINAVFSTLITPSAIKKWWGASSAIVIPEKRGLYAVTWGSDQDDPDYVTYSEIQDIRWDEKLILIYKAYLSKDGRLPFEAEFKVTFSLSANGDACLLQVRQDGFPDEVIANAYYKGCQKGWKDVLENIKKYCEG